MWAGAIPAAAAGTTELRPFEAVLAVRRRRRSSSGWHAPAWWAAPSCRHRPGQSGAVVAWIVTRVAASWIEARQSEAPRCRHEWAPSARWRSRSVVTLRGGRPAMRATGRGSAAGVESCRHRRRMFGARNASEDAGISQPREETDQRSETPPTRGDEPGATVARRPHEAGEQIRPQSLRDPQPIDLTRRRVTPEQQALRNLVAINVVRLRQWADPAVAEAAGFHSIGDADSGHEHYVQWDWIDDDVWLDPDAPESLVYEPQADGSKKLVSAMYMLPRDTALEDIPDYGVR